MKNLCLNNVEYKRLEDCCIILDNKRKPVTKTARKSGVYPYYGANGIQDYVSDYIFDGVFVLIGEDGSVVNENGNPVVNWAEGKIWVNNHAHIIQEKDGVLLRYIFYFIQTIKIKNLIYGNIPKLTGNNFKSLKISVPSLEIQQKIAEILSAQDKLIELKQKLIDQKKQQKKWLMQNFLTGKIRLKDFEGEWKKVKLGNIADVKGGKRIPKGYQLQNENNGFPYITVSDMENGTVNKSTIKYVPIDIIDNIKRYKIYSDDIYISVAGTLGLIGTIPKELNGANLTENADKICDYHCNKQYLISMLSSEIIQNQIKTSQTNNAQPKLAIEQIKNFVFNLPQLEEQTAIAEILSAQDKEIELLEKQLEQEKLKKKALIQFLLKEE